MNCDEYWRTCCIGQTLLVERQGLGAGVASQAACGERAAFLTLEPGLSSQARCVLASADSLASRSIPCHPFLLCICFLALHWPATREGEPVCGLGDSSLPFLANMERGAGSPCGEPGGGRDFTGPCLYRTHVACPRMRDFQTCLRIL